MAVRGPRTGSGRRTADGTREAEKETAPGLDERLVRVRDLAGRPRGTGFLADHHGTLITSHEAVDGLARIVLHAAGDRTCVVGSDAVVPLPAFDLALVRTEGLAVDPLPITVRERIPAGTYVRIAADRWREARVLAATQVTYTATDRFHLLEDALELAIGTAGRDALRLGGGAAGGPVLDAETGAVLAVLGTALQSGQRDVGFAVPLHHPGSGPLADLLATNAATVPAYGIDLNLAGVLELTATSVGQDGPPGALAGYVGRTAPRMTPPHTSAPHPGTPRTAAPRAGAPQRGAGNCATGPHAPAAAPPPFMALTGEYTDPVQPVERSTTARELSAFAEGTGTGTVLALVGAPGTGRTTELAALAARRNREAHPAPTLWLRGADLKDADDSVASAARRSLERAVRIVAASRSQLPGDLGELTVERLARLAVRAGRPLLLLLDGPEEMPPFLAHRLPAWTEGTADWLRDTGARLLVACREEYWERAGAEFPPDLLHGNGNGHGPGNGQGAEGDPPCIRLTDLTPDEARRARSRYGIPDNALIERDARHPLALRLLSEVRAALPDAPADDDPIDRHDVFAAYLDLMCLRIAVRLAAENGLRGTAVRRLAARVSGQVHEAARRSLGPGQGELDRESFEAVFPWGPVPAHLGGGSGWASAVLTEGLLVPAGGGYRFAHEELADWIQGMHLDLDEALHALVHRPRTPLGAHPLPVPHHRAGPVVQALLLLDRDYGPTQLAPRLDELAHALDLDPGSWWAARLLTQTLLRLPDATPYTGVLRLLADRVVSQQHTAPPEFGPDFWTALALPAADRFDLLRRLVLADEPLPETAGIGRFGARPTRPPTRPPAEEPEGTVPRYLDAVARLLAADPTAVQPYLTRWFDDERPLPAMPHATVATAAQALLHTHRYRALDELTEVLVDAAHRRGDELLAVLAEDEPSAVCRAVDRWAHDERPARRVAAMAHGLRTAPHVRSEPDRELLRYAALALLARPADCTVHGGALALLVRDPGTRARHLPQALRHFATGDHQLTPAALVPALVTHPDEVLEAFRARLRGPDAAQVLRTLAHVTTPALAQRITELVLEVAELRPELAGQVAGFVERRLDQGTEARTVLLPLVTELLDDGPEPVRAALATVLGAAGTPVSRPLRQELLEFLLDRERDPGVLDALLHAAAAQREDDGDGMRELVRRTGLLLVRTPDGATLFDRGLVDLGRHVPGFAALMARWLTDTPQEWAAVVGPSTRRMLGNLAGVRVPA
ncbi:trypsin-like peptidase domain-containing protein [Streptomyces hyaluromycini]|uniref:trypsin-like peptidase domain-containing protein n=1 Tax=Streptomyces hyaluromycini TaxID=1377993 RepID=UPI000B5C21ED|nr:trypsin-like peptidase domain-containing protein [Streptomyces hyaluromycini]